jgi:phospholipid transport system substrate-binding protein
MSKALAAWLLLVATAASPTTPLVVVQSSVGRVLALLRDPELARPDNAEKRRAEIHRVAASLFDFPEMARRALARRGTGYSLAERAEFIRLSTGWLERAYVERIQAYAGDRIVYLGESIDQAYARVRAKIVPAGQGEIPVEYRLYRVGARWAVYDVLIGGVSFVEPDRSEPHQVIPIEPLGSLLQKLRQAEALTVPGR